MTDAREVRASAGAWVDDDPDPATRAELQALLDDPSPAAAAEVADRFADRLHFGTAGLRGAVAAGPNRMNVAVVRMATAALAQWLATHRPGSREAGVVVGCDARHGSAEFADEVTRVLAGAGFRLHALERQRPTPLLAFAVPHLGAAAGVMITASHNPPADNGYKLYLGDGAQIVPPVDAEIEELMSEVGSLAGVPVGDLDDPLVTHHGPEITEAFLAALAAESPAPPGAVGLKIVYTPMHGVAKGLFEQALKRAGFPAPIVVSAQAEPDPDFPTVAFPNPEEPGALDLALAEARKAGADVVIANDPDGDRLAVAMSDAAAPGGWRPLSGDQVGALLGDYVLKRTAADPDAGSRLVAASIVSSTMLSKIAATAGAHFEATLTGFKWIVRAGAGIPGVRFVFGYEEALGYSVGTVVRDKDGLGAALAFLGLLTEARNRGRSVLDLLDALETRHGVHLTAQLSIRSASPEDSMTMLRATPLEAIGSRTVRKSDDLSAGGSRLPPSDVLVYWLDGARIIVRPSGTEPKLKVYFEVVSAVTSTLAEARASAADELAAIRSAVEELLQPG